MSPTELRLKGQLGTPCRGLWVVALILVVILGGMLVSGIFDLRQLGL